MSILNGNGPTVVVKPGAEAVIITDKSAPAAVLERTVRGTGAEVCPVEMMTLGEICTSAGTLLVKVMTRLVGSMPGIPTVALPAAPAPSKNGLVGNTKFRLND
jgi:hypothetical protein